jgi:predicted metal-dependent peptidase
MDAVINQFNKDIESLTEPDEDGKPKFEPIDYRKIDGAVADQSWKGYYELLEKDQENDNSEGEGEGEGGEGAPGSGSGDLSKYGDVIDDHSHFGKVQDDSNADIADEQLKDMIQKTARGLKPGETPLEIQKILDEILQESVIPWRVLLRNWIKSSVKTIRKTHILRESISVAGVFPGYKRVPKPEFHVYADMSGSIDDKQAIAFFREIMAIQRTLRATIHLHQFDTRIHSSEVIDKQIPNINRDAYGGTNFQCCVEHARKNKIKSLIIMTDGYASSVDVTGLNVLWAMTEYHQSHGGKEVIIKD